MHFWVNGWDWGWLILSFVWVFALAAALYVLMNWPPGNPPLALQSGRREGRPLKNQASIAKATSPASPHAAWRLPEGAPLSCLALAGDLGRHGGMRRPFSPLTTWR
jgi:hypothetical protein